MQQHTQRRLCIWFVLWLTVMTPLVVTAQIQGGNGLPGGSFPAPNNRVVMYSGPKYTGQSKALNAGAFNARSLGRFLKRNVSSIQIPPGWYVQAIGVNGRTQTFTRSNTMLSAIGWDNQIASGFIGMGNPGNAGPGVGNGGSLKPVVTLYYALNFTGQAVNFGTGSFKYLGLGVDKNITAINIAPGYRVRVYDQQNLRGRSQEFDRPVGDLRQFGWNDRVASIVVYKAGQGGRPTPFGTQ